VVITRKPVNRIPWLGSLLNQGFPWIWETKNIQQKPKFLNLRRKLSIFVNQKFKVNQFPKWLSIFELDSAFSNHFFSELLFSLEKFFTSLGHWLLLQSKCRKSEKMFNELSKPITSTLHYKFLIFFGKNKLWMTLNVIQKN